MNLKTQAHRTALSQTVGMVEQDQAVSGIRVGKQQLIFNQTDPPRILRPGIQNQRAWHL
ncbi:hypothetical protein D3C75_1325300 [compost metagenome]